MKFNKLIPVILAACGVLMLAGCSAKHRTDSAGVSDVNGMNNADGAQTSGMGQGSSWADGSGMNGQGGSAQKRTYYFDFDRSDVRDSDKPSIYANANYVMGHPHAKVIIEGHTDPRGSREYNVALGERRANAVASLMRSRGVSGSQIRVVSYGAERLAAFGHSDNDYQLDRRAVIVYTQK